MLMFVTVAALAVLMSPGGQANARVPVLAELFTSEGCSSCPPADELLRRLIEEQPVEGVEVIGLSEHVDYWDRLGWKDPFSSADFTRRQNEYAATLRRPDIYTPQLVVDGRFEAIGSDWAAVRQALTKAAGSARATLAVSASWEPSAPVISLRVVAEALPAAAAKGNLRVMAAIVEDGLTTSVLRGENARKTLKHSAVARSVRTVGRIRKGDTAGEFSHSVTPDPAWRADRLRIIVFLQDERTRHVLGSAAAAISGHESRTANR